jgi:hypothetical protein
MYNLFRESFPLLLLGTYNHKLMIISISEIIRGEWNCVAKIDLLNWFNSGIINSIAFTTEGHSTFLYCGLRNGSLCYWECQNSGDEILLSPEPRIWEVSKVPLALYQSSVPSQIYILTDQRLFRAESQFRSIELTPVTADEMTIRCMTGFPVDATNSFACICDSRIRIISLEQDVAYRSFERFDWKLNEVIYDQKSDCLLLSSTGVKNASAVMVYSLKPYGRGLRSSCGFPNGETITCMEIWNVKESKRYICVGTRLQRVDRIVGRILVFRIKANHKLEKAAELEVSNPILALHSFGNYVLVSHGKQLSLVKIMADTRK